MCPGPIIAKSVAELSMYVKEKGLATEICKKFEGTSIL